MNFKLSDMAMALFTLFTLILAARAETTIIDYSNTGVLAESPGVQRGYVVYHLWADQRGLDKIRSEHLPKIPNGSTVMLDFEPWNRKQARYPWYGEASDEDNLKMMREYAWIIRELTPEFTAKGLTLATYSLPALMQRNWNAVHHGEGHPAYEKWRGKQLRVLMQAEQSGFLPALRAIGGQVLIVGYMPARWDDSRSWHSEGLRNTIANMDAILDEHDVPHRWLWKPDRLDRKVLSEDQLNIMLDRGGDWWTTKDRKGHAELISAIVERSRRPKSDPLPHRSPDPSLPKTKTE